MLNIPMTCMTQCMYLLEISSKYMWNDQLYDLNHNDDPQFVAQVLAGSLKIFKNISTKNIFSLNKVVKKITQSHGIENYKAIINNVFKNENTKMWKAELCVLSWIKLRMNYVKAEMWKADKSELNHVKQNSAKQISGFAIKQVSLFSTKWNQKVSLFDSQQFLEFNNWNWSLSSIFIW